MHVLKVIEGNCLFKTFNVEVALCHDKAPFDGWHFINFVE